MSSEGASARAEGSPEPAAVVEFKTRVRGLVLSPADEGYDAARKIWNAMIDRRPAVIVRCAGAADVIAAVHLAREHGLVAAVRGGGHNVAGNAVCDGGVMIDLSAMKGIRVDPDRRTVQAQPGLTWGEFDRETQAFDLALTGGIQSTTGIAGFTLGGGFGYLARKQGLTCDNLLSADVVLSDGRLVRASPSENPDLFWGIRGGGGNFGVVTSFEFRLHPLGPVVGGLVLYSLDQAKAVLRAYRHFAASAPDELFTIPMFVTAPEAPHIPPAVRGRTVLAIDMCYAGEPKQAERIIAPLRALAPPLADLVGPRPYTVQQGILDASNPPGYLNYWKSEDIQGLSDGLIDVLTSFASRKPSPLSKILVPQLGGAVARVAEGETAYAHRRAPFLVNINAMWSDPQDAEKAIAWARETWTAVRPFSAGGVYVNFLSEEGADRVREAYGPKTYERLVDVKRKYDPTNFFRMNQNIRPNP